MADKKAYIRLDKVGASDSYESVIAEAPLFNGQFINLGVVDDTLGYDLAKATNATEGAKPDAVVCSVLIDYGNTDYEITEDFIPAGKAARALVLRAGQAISILKEQAPDVAVGDAVTVGAEGFGVKKATAAGEDGAEVVLGTAIRADYLNYVGDLITIRIK